MESIFKLGILLNVVDKVTGPSGAIGKSLDHLKAKASALGPTFDKFRTYGLLVAGGGALMMSLLGGTALATVETQKALGELASVGVADMAVMESAAARFSNQWAGTSKAQFIAAAYDIKSGISSLTDQGVADYTRLAALTGKATKSTTAEMTSLFATGYGIYRDAYANLSDLQFGELFSAGIASSVKAFKTTGGGMAQAISTLGAAATTAKVPMEEQLAILGMLQATMSGSEAGTKYRAVMQAAAIAGHKLKLPLVDANNQLLSMPQILDKLRGKYGDTLDAVEKAKIQQAFGTQEAVAVIDLLYGKVGALTGNIDVLRTSMGAGTVTTEQMAAAMNADIGAGIQLLGQRMHNVTEVIGRQLIPILAPLLAWVGRLAVGISEFAERHGTLTRVVVIGLAVFSALLFVLGSLAAVIGVVGLGLPALATGLSAISGAAAVLKVHILAAARSVWAFTTALLANPLPWIVLGVVALVAALVLLYRRFEGVRNAVNLVLYVLGYFVGATVKVGKELWAALQPVLTALAPLFQSLGRIALEMGGALKWAFLNLTPLGWLIQGFMAAERYLAGLDWRQSGQRIVETLAAGIQSVISLPGDLVRAGFEKIRALLPFSDAKEGPLSALTLSGARIMDTLGVGVRASAPGLRATIAGALAGAALATTVAVTPAGLAPAPTGQRSERQTEAKAPGRSVTIQSLTLQLPNVSDAEGFVKALQALVESYDA